MTGYGRPSPPTTRRRIVSPRPPEPSPPSSAEPDRAFVENAPPPQKAEPTLRSAPEPPKEPAEMAGSKKGRKFANAETKSVAVARVEALVGAGEQLKKALAKVGKEIGSSPLSVRQWVLKARKQKPAVPAKKRASNGAGRRVDAAIAEHLAPPKLDGLDLVLDIIELCERAKAGLTKSQRMRLRTALNERLS
jgi:hypothetical protein